MPVGTIEGRLTPARKISVNATNGCVLVDGIKVSSRRGSRLSRSLIAIWIARQSEHITVEPEALFPGASTSQAVHDWKGDLDKHQRSWMVELVSEHGTRWRIGNDAGRVEVVEYNGAPPSGHREPSSGLNPLPSPEDVRSALALVDVISASGLGDFQKVKNSAMKLARPQGQRIRGDEATASGAFAVVPVVANVLLAQAATEIGEWDEADRIFQHAADLASATLEYDSQELTALVASCDLGIAEVQMRRGLFEACERALRKICDLPRDARLQMRKFEVSASLHRRQARNTRDARLTALACGEYVKACRLALINQRSLDFLRCLCKLGVGLTNLHDQMSMSQNEGTVPGISPGSVRGLAIVTCFGALARQVEIGEAVGNVALLNASHALAMSLRALRKLADYDTQVVRDILATANLQHDLRLSSANDFVLWVLRSWIPRRGPDPDKRISGEAFALIVAELWRAAHALNGRGLLERMALETWSKELRGHAKTATNKSADKLRVLTIFKEAGIPRPGPR